MMCSNFLPALPALPLGEHTRAIKVNRSCLIEMHQRSGQDVAIA